MSVLMAAILKLAFLIGLQLVVYRVFLRPRILTWGASAEEIKMPLNGDAFAPQISATRAILIAAPVAEVWRWVIQLGADRGGFFSYEFIEKALGYEMRAAKDTPEFQEMAVGRIVPGSIDEAKSFIKFNFPVIAVEPGNSFVLQDWGTFALKAVSPTQTRLIVRTHGKTLTDFFGKMVDFVGEALHYIMERRMLMGFKAAAEGQLLSATADNVWLLGVFLSVIGIAVLLFTGQGVLSLVFAGVYGIVWLWVLLIGEPRPLFSTLLLLLVVITTSALG